MKRECAKCKHWQGTRYSKEGDCYHVIGALLPELNKCYIGSLRWSVPFDPHDDHIWRQQCDEYRKIMEGYQKEKEADWGITPLEEVVGSETYYRTPRKGTCGLWKELKVN